MNTQLEHQTTTEDPRERELSLLAAVVDEIAEDAATLAGRYREETIVPEGGE